MAGDQEYEVESIAMAKVVRKSTRSKALIWQYHVKWKGYDTKDNTWEPSVSFEGSEHILSSFWARAGANLKGRDIANLSLFKAGEEFYPTGPPKRVRNQSTNGVPQSGSTGNGSKRKASPVEVTPTRPKRVKPNTVPSQPNTPKPSRSHSSRKGKNFAEVIPASEGDDECDDTEIDPPDQESNIQVAPESPPAAPPHRLRKSQPLVQQVDDFPTMDQAISAKAKASQSLQSDEVVPDSEPPQSSPGRKSARLKHQNKSSLLTYEKGELKTLKGRYSPRKKGESATEQTNSPEEPVEAVSLLPPTGQELLALTGVDGADANDLVDFEEEEPQPPNASQPSEEKSIFRRSLTIAKDKLFPAIAHSVTDAFTSSWKRPTIFGPLGLASESSPSTSSHSTRLCISSSISVPVSFVDISPAINGSSNLVNVLQQSNQIPSAPGKFYQKEITNNLVNTMRTGGSSARVVVSPECDETQKQHFARFQSDLDAGKLFIGLAGLSVLLYCSSRNSSIWQRLNLPTSLTSVQDTILATLVTIEDISGYANLTDQASDAHNEYLE